MRVRSLQYLELNDSKYVRPAAYDPTVVVLTAAVELSEVRRMVQRSCTVQELPICQMPEPACSVVHQYDRPDSGQLNGIERN